MNARRSLLAISIALLGAAAVVFACGGAPGGGLMGAGDAGDQDATITGSGCVPGQQISCACVGGSHSGVQTCNTDGHGYAACRGCQGEDDSSAGGGDAGATGDDASPPGKDAGSAGEEGGRDSGCTPLTSADKCAAGGCECPTPACCGTACQSAHSDGLGQSFYDCVALGTHSQAQARAACAEFTGDAGACAMSSACCDDSLGLCITTASTDAVCGRASAQCHCWSYTGNDSGTVQTPQTGCAEICPGAGDPGWN